MTAPDETADTVGRFTPAMREILLPGGEDGDLSLVCRWPRGRLPKALVVFCHGLGAGGSDYTVLSGHWAAHGYLVVHPTFPDSLAAVALAEPSLGLDPVRDVSRWPTMPAARARFYAMLHAPGSWLGRVAIVERAMAAREAILAATCGAVAGSLPCAIAGHSFGAYTAQLLAGAEIDLPEKPASRFRDDRFAAAILLSAQGRDQQGLRERSWDGMTGPVLTVTGTLDQGAKGQDWRWKTEPHEFAPPGAKYLAVLEGADHYLGGLSAIDASGGNPEHRDAVLRLTTAFLDAHLAGDEAARSWLGAVGDRIGGCRVLFRRK